MELVFGLVIIAALGYGAYRVVGRKPAASPAPVAPYKVEAPTVAEMAPPPAPVVDIAPAPAVEVVAQKPAKKAPAKKAAAPKAPAKKAPAKKAAAPKAKATKAPTKAKKSAK